MNFDPNIYFCKNRSLPFSLKNKLSKPQSWWEVAVKGSSMSWFDGRQKGLPKVSDLVLLKSLPLKKKIWRKDITFASNSLSCKNLNLSSMKFDPNFWINLVQKLEEKRFLILKKLNKNYFFSCYFVHMLKIPSTA